MGLVLCISEFYHKLLIRSLLIYLFNRFSNNMWYWNIRRNLTHIWSDFYIQRTWHNNPSGSTNILLVLIFWDSSQLWWMRGWNIEVECGLWWHSSPSYPVLALLAVSPGLSWLKDVLHMQLPIIEPILASEFSLRYLLIFKDQINLTIDKKMLAIAQRMLCFFNQNI